MCRLSMILLVNVVLNKTVVVDRVLMLERSCSHSHQRNATLCCAKNRRCESSIALNSEKGTPFGRIPPV